MTEQSSVHSVLSARFQVSAGEVIGVAIAPDAALKGVAAAILSPDGSPVAVFGGGSFAQGSFYARLSGTYVAVFGNTAIPGVNTNFAVTVAECWGGMKQLTFTDGPVNHYDGQETITIYCNADGSVNVWTANNSAGYFAFTATKGELAEVATKPHQDTLVKSDLGVTLYRLINGDLQINASNSYVFIWNEC